MMKRKSLFTIFFAIILSLAVVYAAPLFNSESDKTVVAEEELVFNIANTAPDNGSTSYTVNDTSSWINLTRINDTLLQVNLTPASGQVGTHALKFTASDVNTSNSTIVTVTVEARNPMLNVSNASFGDVDQNSTTGMTFTITNAGNINLTNINITHDTTEDLTFSSIPSSLEVGASDSVTATLTVLTDHASGSLTIPSNFTSDELNKTFNVTATVTGSLTISDLDVTIDGEKESNLDNGDTINDNAIPGSRIKFDVQVENGFTDDQDIDMEDVEVTITIEDIDDSEDLDEESDSFDIAPEKQESVTLEFDIPLDADEDEYDILIEVDGRDSNNVDHEVRWTLKMNVLRERNDIAIRKAVLNPTAVSCNRRATVDVTVQNIGRTEEDEVVVAIESPALGISIHDAVPFELDNDVDDEDSKYSKLYSLDVGEDISPGTYAVEIRSFYDFSKVTDFERVNLKVEECSTGEEPEEEAEEEGEEEVEQPPATEPEEEEEAEQPTETENKSTTVEGEKEVVNFKDTAAYSVFLVLSYVMGIALVSAVLIKIFRRG